LFTLDDQPPEAALAAIAATREEIKERRADLARTRERTNERRTRSISERSSRRSCPHSPDSPTLLAITARCPGASKGNVEFKTLHVSDDGKIAPR
jgi:hypothetical protein